MKLTLTALILILSNWVSPSLAQIFINYDLGFSKIAYQNQELSKNYYHDLSPFLINIGLYYQNQRAYLKLGFSYQKFSLKPVIGEINYFENNTTNLESYQVQLDYLDKIESLSKRMNVFIGYNIRVKSSNYKWERQSEFYNNTLKFRESIYSDFSIIGRIEYIYGKTVLQYDIGLGLLRYYEESDPWYDEYGFFGLGPNYYKSFQTSLSLMLWVNNKLAFKPEYSFRFDRTEYFREVKYFQQSVLIGGVVKLW